MIIGYARVSTDGQTLDAQHAALHDAGCQRIFSEKESGARTDRQQLAKAIAALTAGDTLIVTKLDRLARSTRDLLNTLDAIAKAGATFKSMGDPWADTTTPHGRLMLTVLGGLAEFERHLILARTSEGRTRAQSRGVKFGRRAKLTLHKRQEALERRSRGEPLVDIARSYVGQSQHNLTSCVTKAGQPQGNEEKLAAGPNHRQGVGGHPSPVSGCEQQPTAGGSSLWVFRTDVCSYAPSRRTEQKPSRVLCSVLSRQQRRLRTVVGFEHFSICNEPAFWRNSLRLR